MLWGKKAPPPPKPVEMEWDLAVPRAAAATFVAAETNAAVAKIDPNVATEAELVTLTGIGEVLAGRIIAYREEGGRFREAADLARVDGISAELARDLEPHLKFETDK